MLHRTIFIGLGSTGCNTIDALQDIAYLSTGSADMGGAWAYLKLDTAEPGDRTFCGDTAHRIHIQVMNETATLEAHLRERDRKGWDGEDLSWLWKDGHLRIRGLLDGAGMNRRYGRACIYYYWNVEHDTQKNIKTWLQGMKSEFIDATGERTPNAIQNKLSSILPTGSPVPKVSNQEVRIVIILALGGGTGTGGLLELARRIYQDNISRREIVCLSYPPSVDHPQAGDILGNDRRYNAMECLYYYEQYRKDDASPNNLKPHFIISPSKNDMTLAAVDPQAMRQLEYLGAMFLSRVMAALDFDAIMVDLQDAIGKPYSWSVALAGVRIPALEIKAREIYQAAGKICGSDNSKDPISWYKDVQIAAGTMDEEATGIVRECFDHIGKFLLTKFATQDPPRKVGFHTEYINNKDDWFDKNYEKLSEEMLKLAVGRIRSILHSNNAARSVKYLEELIRRMKGLLDQVPALDDTAIEKTYGQLKGDPPSEPSRNKLFVWKYRDAVAMAIAIIEEKLDHFKSILQGVSVNQDAITRIQQRQETVIYKNIIPENFKVEIPPLSFMDLEPVFNMFSKPQERLNTQDLKRELMKELSRSAKLPAGTSFDRTQFSKDETRAFLRDKLDGPMLNLVHKDRLATISKVCLGGALTELIDSSRESQKKQFEDSIADLGLQVAASRMDPELISIMSPLQLDALKIWDNCQSANLSIGQPAFRRNLTFSADSDTWGDYYPPRPDYSTAVEAFSNLLICSDVQRPDSSHLNLIDVLSQYRPTSFGTTSYSVVLSCSAEQKMLELPANGDVNTILCKLIEIGSNTQGKEFLNRWNDYIKTKSRSDITLNSRMDTLFQLGNFRLTQPDGSEVTVYKPHI